MQSNLIPTCAFPSTVIFVDDGHDFLAQAAQQLNQLYQFYDSPYDALNNFAIFSRQHVSAMMPGSEGASIGKVAHPVLGIELTAIQGELENPLRFSEISVVIADYAMPGMNGLDFFQKMGKVSLKRLLLVKSSERAMATLAVEEKIIDAFICKDNPAIIPSLNQTVRQLERQFFCDMSELLCEQLGFYLPSCLRDLEFINFFNAICKEHDIVEFYLISGTKMAGSFVLLDELANLNYLIVKTEAELANYYTLAIDNYAPQDVLEKLRTRQEIPYLVQSHGWDDWSACLYPAKKIKAKQAYYYAWVKDPYYSDIRKEKIFSYREYLKNVAAMSASPYTHALKQSLSLTED